MPLKIHFMYSHLDFPLATLVDISYDDDE